VSMQDLTQDKQVKGNARMVEERSVSR
jgi:hypothetical protein